MSALRMLLQTIPGLEQTEITKIRILDPFLKRLFARDKMGILDIHIQTKSGKHINIEMQVERGAGTKQRIIFYLSKLSTEQIGIGQKYSRIKQSICAMLTGYVLFPASSDYIHSFVFMNEKTGEIWTDLQKVVIIELPKIPVDDDNTSNWEILSCFNLNNAEELKMFALKHPKVKPICDNVVRLNFIRSVRMIAESREKLKRDMASYKELGRAEGHAAAKAESDEIIKAKDAALSEKDAALSEKDAALSQQAAALSEKDVALFKQAAALSEKDAALSQQAAALSEKDVALLQHAADIASLKAQLAKH
jgi:predicted transposase/invertase (TIGR01784 family)